MVMIDYETQGRLKRTFQHKAELRAIAGSKTSNAFKQPVFKRPKPKSFYFLVTEI